MYVCMCVCVRVPAQHNHNLWFGDEGLVQHAVPIEARVSRFIQGNAWRPCRLKLRHVCAWVVGRVRSDSSKRESVCERECFCVCFDAAGQPKSNINTRTPKQPKHTNHQGLLLGGAGKIISGGEKEITIACYALQQLGAACLACHLGSDNRVTVRAHQSTQLSS